MEFRILGSIEAVGDEGPIPLGAPKQRALLAFLLLNANTVVSRLSRARERLSGNRASVLYAAASGLDLRDRSLSAPGRRRAQPHRAAAF